MTVGDSMKHDPRPDHRLRLHASTQGGKQQTGCAAAHDSWAVADCWGMFGDAERSLRPGSTSLRCQLQCVLRHMHTTAPSRLNEAYLCCSQISLSGGGGMEPPGRSPSLPRPALPNRRFHCPDLRIAQR